MLQAAQEMKMLWKLVRTVGDKNVRVREEIKASWARSLAHGVNPYMKANQTVLTAEEFKNKLQENRELLEVAVPVVKNIYDFVKGSGFAVAIADKDGVILVMIGDEEGLEFTRRANLIEGSVWSEEVMGTNAIGLCLVEGKPIQVYGYEHFCICCYNGTCSAAPIRDPNGRIIGALDITGYFEKVHYHTLGMVVAGANAIESQLAIKRVLRENVLANHYKNLIMESISDGILTIDNYGYITHLNTQAAKLLRLDPSTAIGKRLTEIFGDIEANRYFINLIQSSRAFTDTIIHIHRKHEKIRCNVSCRPLNDHDGTSLGRVVVLQEFSRVNRLVNRLAIPKAKVSFSDLVGEDPVFLEAVKLGKAAANSDSNVLLLGESGTGKELFAQSIHNASIRAEQPFVSVNCGAIPRELIASELFGYEEGAFTGARKGGNPGKFELADQGTIFLDEIGEMPLDLQAALLRVLEEQRVMRLGGREYLPVNVRIIAATNKNLLKEVERGTFRRDLFYRLNVMVIFLPALRERREDIALLTNHFVKRLSKNKGKDIKGVSPEVMAIFLNYHWPGNVRELQNVLERAVNLCTGTVITPDLLPPELSQYNNYMISHNLTPTKEESKLIKKAEEQAIRNCLARYKSKTKAAEYLGISRATLYRKIKQYGIELEQ
ncbi:GAF modulated sigma54 specific transcriptional regulator, Fis family [Desulfofundulus kuznetsovii DSM 6115]|uniref:GAF modulated sigma54 specific transcriptional regulator, Fis family n=1 Tax=Desulfofundulus kuznetsovii (strain DSM 6115 / VKM B-1805 / 17) TaxID=760568 RepID=A0AAU8PK11_DESK7|nr:GAF modulated sigma54 specific transcriptional regulator, Fis family [Desulfofundulus kuznetsovii DSM 6115]